MGITLMSLNNGFMRDVVKSAVEKRREYGKKADRVSKSARQSSAAWFSESRML